MPNARLELYNNLNQCIAAATSDTAGAYSFTLPGTGNFTVRAVNDTVESNRLGYVATLLAVQTFRTNGDIDTNAVADADPNRVGGENPAGTDPAQVATCIPGGGDPLPGTAQSIAVVHQRAA